MIYISDSDHQLLKKRAQVSRQSLSELVREAISFYLDKIAKRPRWDNDPLWQMAGSAAESNPNTAGRDHDQILYGGKS